MLNNKTIAALEEKGFMRWTKGNMDRLYIDAKTMGLDVDRYKTGNISGATYRGERISNTRAREMVSAKTFIDIATGEIHSTNWTLEQDVREIYEETMEELEEKPMWYAVMRDLEDGDWGTGSYDKGEALTMARELRADGYDDAYIAVIEESNNSVCVEEIHEIN